MQILAEHPNECLYVHIYVNQHRGAPLSQFPPWVTTVLTSVTMDEFCLFSELQ